jgi:hypothetical protein
MFSGLACRSSERIVDGAVGSELVGMISGAQAYDYDLELEEIAYDHTLSHYSSRSGGSSGANATADWLMERFQNYGLEACEEPFQFLTWDLLSRPTLVVDDDGSLATVSDQTTLDSFICIHCSYPTPSRGVFGDLAVLPLPSAADASEVGMNPINITEWNAVDITGKILLIGREVCSSYSWHNTFENKLASQPPLAIVWTWWYSWMSWIPDFSNSAEGMRGNSVLYSGLKLPVGFVDYYDGMWIRDREKTLNVSAQVKIEAVIDTGTHCNVIGKLAGSKYPDKFIVVSSHYDSPGLTSAFLDNGAGTAGVLELARVFSEANKTGLISPKYTILFLPFADEELGCVGAINFVMQHQAQMKDIVAVINLDCIGSDNFFLTKTEPGPKFDLDQVMLKAAQDLNITATLDPGTGGDDMAFKDPVYGENMYADWWNLTAGIADAIPVNSSIYVGSSPIFYQERWTTGLSGYAHTSYDNSTSTATLNWVEVTDLDNQIKIVALSLMRIVSPLLCDVNFDGTVNMRDVNLTILHFQTTSSSQNWNADFDVTGPTPLVPDGIVNMRDISEAIRRFNQKDL